MGEPTTNDELMIAGIPASIPRERMVALLAELGLDASRISRDGIHIDWHRIQCEVIAHDDTGRPYADSTHSMVRHSVAIPIVDEKPQPADPPAVPRLRLWSLFSRKGAQRG